MAEKVIKYVEFWREQYQNVWNDLGHKFFTKGIEKAESPIEVIAWFAIVHLIPVYGMYNFTAKCQWNIAGYRVDFFVTHGDKRIVIECDGHEFHEKTKEQASSDKRKDRELQKLGFIILRYSGSDIVNNPSKITDDLNDIIGRPDWDK